MVKNDKTVKSSPRKSRLKFNFPIETLIRLSHFRQDEAAKILGVAPITLKRNCQRHKYRWPYRTIKAQRRRADRSASQKKQVDKESVSPSLPPSELLLALNKAQLDGSPSPISSIAPAISSPTVCPPKAQFPLADQPIASEVPPQLPPLTLFLRKLQLQSPSATLPCLKTERPMHQYPLEHTRSFCRASFHPTAPKCPSGGLFTLVHYYQLQEQMPATGFHYTNF